MNGDSGGGWGEGGVELTRGYVSGGRGQRHSNAGLRIFTFLSLKALRSDPLLGLLNLSITTPDDWVNREKRFFCSGERDSRLC